MTERGLIKAYERNFDVRQIDVERVPVTRTDYGLTVGMILLSTGDTVAMTLTLEGQDVFGYLRSDVVLTVSDTYHFLSDPTPPTGAETVHRSS